MKRFLVLLLAVSVLQGCFAGIPWDELAPPPRPDVEPIEAEPVSPDAVPYATVQAVEIGMTRAELLELLGEPAEAFTPEAGVEDLSWPGVGPLGEARRVEIRIRAGKVAGRPVLY